MLPLIRREIEATELWIVGQNPPTDVLQLRSHAVHVTGRVDDVLPYYQRSSVCVVPLRAGGGTRLKILEAMAMGLPCVTTSMVNNAIGATLNKEILVADTLEGLADHVQRLMKDENEYNNRIRKVSGGAITTVAGTGNFGYSGDGALATLAQINFPSDVAVDSAGNLYIADQSNNRIRKVSVLDGKISTVAGTGANGYSGDGPATLAQISRSLGQNTKK